MGKHQVEQRAVFLDRDGVLNRPWVFEGRPYPPTSIVDFQLYDDVAAGCARLKDAGFLLIVVTNQPDIGRKTQSRSEVDQMHAKLSAALPMLDRIEICCHAGIDYGEPCDCRKPKPGMLFRAAEALPINFGASYLIGDRSHDVACAHAAGCRAIFIDRGYSESSPHAPDAIVSGFAAAVEWLLRDAERAQALPSRVQVD